MIESVYSNENAESNRTGIVQTCFKMPKNIRQVGKSNAIRKIYVEDYVMTFIKQLSGEDYSTCHVAVLVGQNVNLEQGRCLFVSGAVEVKDIDPANNLIFTNDHWTDIYENIKKYFVESEIVGWFLGGPGFLLDEKEKILKTHIDNFAGQDKVLATFDNMEKEEMFYFYENGTLSKQEGYYIYYEKNEEMQTYMIEHNEKPSNEESYDDKVSKQIRTIIQSKKPVSNEDKGISRLMYAAGTLLAVIILVVGAAMFSNYDQMKNMQSALDSLSNNLKQVESVFLNDENSKVVSENTVNQGHVANIPKESSEEIGGSLDVEVLSGGVSPLEEISSNNNDNKGHDNNENNEKDDSQGKTNKTGNDDNSDDEEDDEDEDTNSETSNHNTENTVEEVMYYTVKAGDSLAGISYKLYNSANYINKIKKLNNIEDEDMIYIGQKLIVP